MKNNGRKLVAKGMISLYQSGQMTFIPKPQTLNTRRQSLYGKSLPVASMAAMAAYDPLAHAPDIAWANNNRFRKPESLDTAP